jgi:hypothetical protein
MLLVICCASNAFAYDSFVGTISRVYPHSDTPNGDFIIMFSSDTGTTCSNAGSPKYYYVAVGQSQVSQASINKLYAAALAAAASGNRVRIWFDANAPQCWVNAFWVEY